MIVFKRLWIAVGAALVEERTWLEGVDASGRSGAWWLLDDELWASLGAMTPQAPGPSSGALRHAGGSGHCHV